MTATDARMMMTAKAYIPNPSAVGGVERPAVFNGTGAMKYQRAAAPSIAATAPARHPQMKPVSRMAGMKVRKGKPPLCPASTKRANRASDTVASANA